MAAQSYDKSKDLIKGEALLIFLGGYPVAYAKKHDFKLSPEEEDVSSKFSGKYAETVLGTVKWNVTVESLVSVTKGHTSANLFRQLAAAGTVVDMKIAAFSITEKPTGKEIAIGAISYQGNVTVGEVSESSARGEYATFSATLNGSGPLKDGAGNEVGTPAALAALTAGG